MLLSYLFKSDTRVSFCEHHTNNSNLRAYYQLLFLEAQPQSYAIHLLPLSHQTSAKLTPVDQFPPISHKK